MINFKTRNGIVSILVISVLYLFYVCMSVRTTTFASTAHNRTTTRLTPERRHMLTSVLAHIRASYSTNRTPEYSTPPLLVLYSCKPNQQCGKLSERLLDITTSYYYAMLNKVDAAFAYDMTFPVQFEWFFEPTPGHMAMRTNQAQFYLDRAELGQFKSMPILQGDPDTTHRILGTTSWTSRDWNKTSGRVGRYGLGHLDLQSDWFFVASRLLFRRPSDWLSEQLAPYRNLMGTVRLGEGLNGEDPSNLIWPGLNAWFRVGVRVTEEREVDALAAHVLKVCEGCHVFVSATSAILLDRMRQRLSTVAVHAVAEGYEFDDLDVPPKSWKLFESNEEGHLKRQYARVFMDWLILSRMDYLVGNDNDMFIKTVAWTAQVQTDVLMPDGEINSLSDW